MDTKKKFSQYSKSNQAFYIFNAVFWIIVMFLILYPLYLVIIASVSDPDAIVAGKVIWHPVDFSFIGYQSILKYSEMLHSYANSIFYTVVSVSISIVVTLAAAYTLSRPKFIGKGLINLFFVFTMFFNGGLIPTFLVMKDIGLYNTPMIMILMGCVSVWNLMVARTYIQTNIPHELYEAAMLDGTTHFQYFFKIVLFIMAFQSGMIILRDLSILKTEAFFRCRQCFARFWLHFKLISQVTICRQCLTMPQIWQKQCVLQTWQNIVLL